ncbi:MAG: TonB-dependent receptor plug domain-containing protein [Chthoniobacterales bacterium]|nr:TonB-dependent receptor plug domain-containing protein [Chthoniobacterales bacterium]
MKSFNLALAALSALTLTAATLEAQTAFSPPVNASTTSDPVASSAPGNPSPTPVPSRDSDQSVERLVVTGAEVPIEQDVVPTHQALSSVFGTDTNIKETPRAVTVVTARQIEEEHIRAFDDLSRASADVFTAAQFGVPGLPQIRGQDGEVFENGLRRNGGNNGYGLPFSFNPVEQLDIVKGPPSAVYGPTQRVAGYVNFVSKQPYFDALHGEAWATIGEYDQYRWGLDFGGPLTQDKKTAFRFSYEGEDSGSFYDFVEYKANDYYLALASRTYDNLRIDFNVEYFDVPHYPDNAGFNRPTQDLIDNGRYVTGPANGLGFGSTVTPTGLVDLPRSQVNTAPGDGSAAHTVYSQAIVTLDLGPKLSLVNRTSFQYLDKETQNANSFVEIIDNNYTVENRTEAHVKYTLPFFGNSFHTTVNAPADGKDSKAVQSVTETTPGPLSELVTGFDFRFNHIKGFSNFNFEADNLTDLTAPLSTRFFPRDAITGSLPLPGYPGRFGGPALVSSGGNYPTGLDSQGNVGVFGNADTNDSNIYQVGYFLQNNFAITDKLSLLIGGRGDLIFADVTDPLPPAGFAPASDSTVVGEGAGNGSLSYKLFPWMTTYGTYSFSQSYNSALGGGLALVDNTIKESNFHIASDLYEIGSKFSFFEDRLFISVAGFYQDLNRRSNFGGANIKYNTKGLEFESTFQPNKNFFTTLNYSYFSGHLDNVGGVLQATGTVYDAFNPSRPDLVPGTGAGSPNFFNFPPDDYEVSGFPRSVVSAFANYTLDCGLGASLGVVATSRYHLDLLGKVIIPAQYTLNAAVFYRQPRWEARVDVLNLTDEENFSPSFGFFGGGFLSSDIVYPELPLRVEATIKFKF